jgi:hypothetical protein
MSRPLIADLQKNFSPVSLSETADVDAPPPPEAPPPEEGSSSTARPKASDAALERLSMKVSVTLLEDMKRRMHDEIEEDSNTTVERLGGGETNAPQM